MIRETAHPDVNLIFGAVIDESMGDEISITVIATGFANDGESEASRAPASTAAPRRAERTDVYSSQTIDRDNIEIPAFLRRR